MMAGRIEGRIIRSHKQVDGSHRLISLAAKNLSCSVCPVGYENFVGLSVIDHRAGPSGGADRTDPFSGPQIQDFNRAVLLCRNEQPLPLSVYRHMVQRPHPPRARGFFGAILRAAMLTGPAHLGPE